MSRRFTQMLFAAGFVATLFSLEARAYTDEFGQTIELRGVTTVVNSQERYPGQWSMEKICQDSDNKIYAFTSRVYRWDGWDRKGEGWTGNWTDITDQKLCNSFVGNDCLSTCCNKIADRSCKK